MSSFRTAGWRRAALVPFPLVALSAAPWSAACAAGETALQQIQQEIAALRARYDRRIAELEARCSPGASGAGPNSGRR